MEQNNNNDNKAMEAIKNTAKNVAKKETKKVLGKILVKILPAIGIFFLCLLAVGLVMAVFVTIINFIKGLFGLNNQSAMSTAEQANAIVSITSSGYEINPDYTKSIIEELQTAKVDTDAMGLTSDNSEEVDSENVDPDNIDTLDDMIYKYIETEVKTMYPSIASAGTILDGSVIINRMSAETGESKRLYYMTYDNFMKAVEEANNSDEENISILNFFTLNPDNFKMYIATYETTIYYDYDEGQKVEKTRKNIIEAKQVDYQTYLQAYGTPLNYFIAMHLVTGDKKFMNELVNMVNEKNDIELTFVESTEKEYLQVDYQGEITTTVWSTVQTISQPTYDFENTEEDDDTNNSTSILDELDKDVTIDMPDFNDVLEGEEVIKEYKTITSSETVPINTGNISDYSKYIEPKQYLIEKITGQGYLKVTKANTWRLESDLDVQVNDSIKFYIQENEITLANPEKGHTVVIDQPDNTNYDEVDFGAFSKGYIDEITNEWFENYSISVTEKDKGYEITEFMELIEKYPKVKNNLKTSPSLLFYLIEQNENTQELAGLMKYIIYEYTGIDYGITDLDQVFQLQNFSTVSGIYGNTVKEKVWWALIDAGYSKIAAAGAMGNIMEESGFKTNNVQNSCQDRVGTDEVYTEKVNNGTYTEDDFANDRAGYGLCQWTASSRKRKLYEYIINRKGANIDNADFQINFFMGELTGKGDAAEITTRIYKGHIGSEGITATHDDWASATSVDEATLQFMRFFESPGNTDSLEKRRKSANEYYEEFFDAERPVHNYEWSTTGLSCPIYYQSDKEWGSYPYNYKTNGTISSGGCGACALAMAVSGLTGQEITPIEIVEYLNSIGKNTVSNGAESAKAIANKYSLTYEKISRSNKNAINDALDDGKCLIFSIYANGIYTGEGHFIMCNGRNGDSYYVLESAKYYTPNRQYLFNQVFTDGAQGIFVLGK